MSRTGQQQATDAQKTYMDNSNKAFAQGQQGIAQYERNIGQLAKGGQVGADPWLSPTYLATQGKLTANATSGENDAAAKVMRDTTLRAGGTNTSATNYATKALALNKMRLADTLNAGRTAGDFNKNIDYQQSLARAPLAEVSGEAPYYGTATSGQSQALGDLTQFGLASYGPWNDLISGISGAAGAGMTAFCPAEGSLYLMADGSEKPVEKLVVGEDIMGVDDEPETIEEIQSGMCYVIQVRTDSGHSVRNSPTHAYILAKGGFAVAARSLGKMISTAKGPSRVVSIEPAGLAKVFNVITNRSHSYRADGVWALGVGDAERHVSMDQWREIGEQLFKDRTKWAGALVSEECVSR